MSISALAPADDFDGFDDLLAFAAIVADFDNPLAGLAPATQPHGEPLPPADESLRRREHRPARSTADRAAIERSMRGEV